MSAATATTDYNCAASPTVVVNVVMFGYLQWTGIIVHVRFCCFLPFVSPTSYVKRLFLNYKTLFASFSIEPFFKEWAT